MLWLFVDIVVSFTEYGTAYAHHIASFLNCQLIITAHTCRYGPEIRAVMEVFLLICIKDLLETAELATDLSLIIGVAGHSHYTAYGDVLKLLPLALLKHCGALIGRETELGLLGSYVQLKQACYVAVEAGGLAVYLSEFVIIVDSLYDRYVRCHKLDLIALDVADEMPLYVCGKNLALGGHLLDLVLAEYALTGIISLLEHLGRMGLGYRYKRYSCGEGGFDSVQVLFDHIPVKRCKVTQWLGERVFFMRLFILGCTLYINVCTF